MSSIHLLELLDLMAVWDPAAFKSSFQQGLGQRKAAGRVGMATEISGSSLGTDPPAPSKGDIPSLAWP